MNAGLDLWLRARNRFAAALGAAITGLFGGVVLASSIDLDASDETGVVTGAGLGLLIATVGGYSAAEHFSVQEITLIVR